MWKRHIRSLVPEKCRTELLEGAKKKSSLKWWLLEDFNWGIQPIWQSCSSNTEMLTAAHTRVKILCGRYKTQKLLAKFNKNENPTCKLCQGEAEDTFHLVSVCPRTDDIRREFLGRLGKLCSLEDIPEPRSRDEICWAALNGGDFMSGNSNIIKFKAYSRKANQLSNMFCKKLDARRHGLLDSSSRGHSGF